jgi:competence protein CoiA
MQYFAHKAVGECSTAAETEAHRRLKQLAVEVARAYGWVADTEAMGMSDDGEYWRADVLACKGTAKVAIEIQWSTQTSDETMRRQKRYEKSDIRCLWLFRHPGFPVDHSLPAVLVSGNLEDDFVAQVQTGTGTQELPMREFLEAAFGKRFRFGLPVGITANVSVWGGCMDCWSCGAETQIITRVCFSIGSNVEHEFSVPDLTNRPHIAKSVLSRIPKELSIGAIKHRFSKTQERRYLSNGCFHCGALMGAFFEHDAWDGQVEVLTYPLRIDEHCIEELLCDEESPEAGDQDKGIGWYVYDGCPVG